MARSWHLVTDAQTVWDVESRTLAALPKAGDHEGDTIELTLLKHPIVSVVGQPAELPDTPAQYYKATYRKQNPNFELSSWWLEAVHETRDG